MKHKRLCLLAYCCTLAGCLFGATYYVAPTGVDDTAFGRGESWDLPYATIGYAVSKAVDDNDVVLVSNAIYEISARIDINNGIRVLGFDSVGIAGDGNPEDVVVKGDGNTQCFGLNQTNAFLAGVTITNGMSTSDSWGGGVTVLHGTLSNCVATGNEAGSGAGVMIHHGTVMNSTIISNNSTSVSDTRHGGGGVAFRVDTTSGRLLNSRIADNHAANRGGGINSFFDTGIISNCVIESNVAEVNGGGIAGQVVIYDSIIRSNTAGAASSQGGGGVFANRAISIVVGCLIEGNETLGGFGGGGIAVRSGQLRLLNSTLRNNTSVNWGGGLYSYPIAPTDGTRHGSIIVNSEIVNNNALQGAGIYAYTLTAISNSIIADNYVTGDTISDAGGGVRFSSSGSDQELWNCFILRNTAMRGGGLFLDGVNSGVYGCLVADNNSNHETWGQGGGIFITGGGTVESCTIVNNRGTGASGNGGGLLAGSEVVVRNTIIYGNTADTVSSNWHGGNIYLHCCTMPTNSLPGYGNIEVVPGFVSFEQADFRLSAGSACINSGTNQNWMIDAVDLNGLSRLDRFSGLVDIGCYEYISQGTILRIR